jgi:hypothetical protein
MTPLQAWTFRKLKRVLKRFKGAGMPREHIYQHLSRHQLAQLLDGYISLVHEGVTTESFNQALISAYCKTNGFFQAYIHEIESKSQMSMGLQDSLEVEIPNQWGSHILKTEETSVPWLPFEPDKALSLAEHGYQIMPFLLEEGMMKQLLDAASGFTYKIRTASESESLGDYRATLGPDVVTAYAATEQLINNAVVRELYRDSRLLNSVRAYLDCPKIRLRDVNMWFTRPQSKASSSSAQLYHFDQASIKWVKIFFFLVDVNSSTGPHFAILGTHKPGSKPARLLDKGYARISDQEVDLVYGKYNEQMFCLPKGGVLMADTNAWHKGSPVHEGYRLVLEFEFTACVEQSPWLAQKGSDKAQLEQSKP